MKCYRPVGGSHNGKDTFRQLLELWGQEGFCSIHDSPDDYVWAISPGYVLLYDYPRLDDRPVPSFKFGLFGNTVPDWENSFPWIFWAQQSRLLKDVRSNGVPGYEEREIESIFLGKIDNKIQKQNRKKQNWKSAGVELFICPTSTFRKKQYRFTPREYLVKLLHSRFGLCLPGYGPKCNREIELLGTGVVPIFTPGVDNSYFEPLVENQHFLRVDEPGEVRDRIESVSREEWNRMQRAGTDWFERNASVRGSFETTERIIRGVVDSSRL